jgi:hypothetical protein
MSSSGLYESKLIDISYTQLTTPRLKSGMICTELGMAAQGTIRKSPRTECVSRIKAFALEPQCPIAANLDGNLVRFIVAGIGSIELGRFEPASEILRTISEDADVSDTGEG